jgi:DNA-binding transcriptional regulator YhcF (GntR family)
MKSWIKIDREITSHWIFSDPWKFRNWIDLLTLVNYQEQKVNIKGVILTCKRGETLCSLDTLAKRWNCDKSKVRRFLKLLESDSMIVLKSEQITTRLTICKYELYQGERNANETKTKRKRNGSETQMTPNKNENNEYNEENEDNSFTTIVLKEDISIDPIIKREQQFDWFWETYGKKVGKDIAKPKFMKLKDEDIVKILDHVPKYVASKPDRQFRKDPSTYINQKTWNDEIITETFTKPQTPLQNGNTKPLSTRDKIFAILQRDGDLGNVETSNQGFDAIQTPGANDVRRLQ